MTDVSFVNLLYSCRPLPKQYERVNTVPSRLNYMMSLRSMVTLTHGLSTHFPLLLPTLMMHIQSVEDILIRNKIRYVSMTMMMPCQSPLPQLTFLLTAILPRIE